MPRISKINNLGYVKLLLVIALSMIGGYFLLVLADLIPVNMIAENVKESAEILKKEEEGQSGYPTGFIEGWFIDSSTDADCLSIAYNRESSNHFYNAINCYQIRTVDDLMSTDALLRAVRGDTGIKQNHSYLWHGYLTWLKPTLIFLNIGQIRSVCFLVYSFLAAFICAIYVKKDGKIYAFLPFLISIAFYKLQMASLSLLFFVDISIAFVASICVLCLYDNYERFLTIVFACTGFCVAFSSMLIMPVVTIGFPLVVYLSIANDKSPGKKLVELLRYVISWMMGYAITMGTKIIIDLNVLNSGLGLSRFLQYTGKKEGYSAYDRMKTVISTIHLSVTGDTTISVFVGLIVLLIVVTVVTIHLKRRTLKKAIVNVLKKEYALLVVSIFPFLWCFICPEHSLHGWTPWIFSVSIFALAELLYKFSKYK